MTITLPLPDRRLSPNARIHWATKSKITKAARREASYECKPWLNHFKGDIPRFSKYRLAFYWPDNRRRDCDNAIASLKAAKDGIADALGIDDSTLHIDGVTFQIDRSNPRVEITLS